ncbi:hypothetical protein D3C72_2502680 [compost metagenome]
MVQVQHHRRPYLFADSQRFLCGEGLVVILQRNPLLHFLREGKEIADKPLPCRLFVPVAAAHVDIALGVAV